MPVRTVHLKDEDGKSVHSALKWKIPNSKYSDASLSRLVAQSFFKDFPAHTKVFIDVGGKKPRQYVKSVAKKESGASVVPLHRDGKTHVLSEDKHLVQTKNKVKLVAAKRKGVPKKTTEKKAKKRKTTTTVPAKKKANSAPHPATGLGPQGGIGTDGKEYVPFTRNGKIGLRLAPGQGAAGALGRLHKPGQKPSFNAGVATAPRGSSRTVNRLTPEERAAAEERKEAKEHKTREHKILLEETKNKEAAAKFKREQDAKKETAEQKARHDAERKEAADKRQDEKDERKREKEEKSKEAQKLKQQVIDAKKAEDARDKEKAALEKKLREEHLVKVAADRAIQNIARVDNKEDANKLFMAWQKKSPSGAHNDQVEDALLDKLDALKKRKKRKDHEAEGKAQQEDMEQEVQQEEKDAANAIINRIDRMNKNELHAAFDSVPRQFQERYRQLAEDRIFNINKEEERRIQDLANKQKAYEESEEQRMRAATLANAQHNLELAKLAKQTADIAPQFVASTTAEPPRMMPTGVTKQAANVDEMDIDSSNLNTDDVMIDEKPENLFGAGDSKTLVEATKSVRSQAEINADEQARLKHQHAIAKQAAKHDNEMKLEAARAAKAIAALEPPVVHAPASDIKTMKEQQAIELQNKKHKNKIELEDRKHTDALKRMNTNTIQKEDASRMGGNRPLILPDLSTGALRKELRSRSENKPKTKIGAHSLRRGAPVSPSIINTPVPINSLNRSNPRVKSTTVGDIEERKRLAQERKDEQTIQAAIRVANNRASAHTLSGVHTPAKTGFARSLHTNTPKLLTPRSLKTPNIPRRLDPRSKEVVAKAAARAKAKVTRTVISQRVKDLAASRGQAIPDNLPTHRSGIAAAGDASEALSSGEERSDSSSESENSDHKRFIATDIEFSEDDSRQHPHSLSNADFKKLQTIQEAKRPPKRGNDDIDVEISRPNRKRRKPQDSDDDLELKFSDEEDSSPPPPTSTPETNPAGVNSESTDSGGHTSKTLPEGNPINSQHVADDFGIGYMTKEEFNSIPDDRTLFNTFLKESDQESDDPFLNMNGDEVPFFTDGQTDNEDIDDGLTDPELGEY